MTTQSRIEWTEQTWNPTTGCTKISPGCKNCYAEVMAARLHAMGVSGYEFGFKLANVPERLVQPMARRKPTVYFVNSMSDLFHEGVSDQYLDQVFAVIRQTPQHTYQILTKRAERVPEYFHNRDCPKNVWLGVSVEDKQYGVPRIQCLRQVDACIRFLSVKPLLEDVGKLDLTDIHWVIVGGESLVQHRHRESVDINSGEVLLAQSIIEGHEIFLQCLQLNASPDATERMHIFCLFVFVKHRNFHSDHHVH